jgi:hypothetical protein
MAGVLKPSIVNNGQWLPSSLGIEVCNMEMGWMSVCMQIMAFNQLMTIHTNIIDA